MAFSKVHSGQSNINGANIIDIEADLSRGLFAFSVVGLPDKAVEEAKDRIGAAIKNSGFESPKSKNHKVVISLAPADIKKEGPAFDLPMALSYLLSAEDISFDPKKKIFLGELALDGTVRKINGVLAIVKEAKKKGFEEIYIPTENTKEASLIKDILIFGIQDLKQIVKHLNTKQNNEETSPLEKLIPIKNVSVKPNSRERSVDFNDIRGQSNAKRALEIAASGGHNILMYGPPGTGKTMLAKAFASILPQLTYEEMLEATAIHSIAGILESDVILYPPLRAPHHTSSYVSVVGGGNNLKPGEITLAHKGVLFLDEFPEFDRRVIESLREPLEERKIRISRAKGTAVFPADFILIAAMNPCPCGNFGSEKKSCTCSAMIIQKYQRKISGPIMDRIDIFIEVMETPYNLLGNETSKLKDEPSEQIRKRVEYSRKIQKIRSDKIGIKNLTNSRIKAKDINKAIIFEKGVEQILNESAEKLALSPRAYHRVMRLSRTIADLDKKEKVSKEHIMEALQYRQKR